MKNDVREEENICANCESAVVINESEVCVCSRNGVVDAHDSCRKFKLDLLKLRPRPKRLPETDATMFLDI